MRKINKIILLLVIIVSVSGIICNLFCGVQANYESEKEEIRALAERTYSQALSNKHRTTFNGYCAMAVNEQRHVLGIDTS